MAIDVKVEGTQEITTAIVEIFSPLTNLAGILGDRVRIYREISLMLSLKKAQEIIHTEGLKVSEPPLKFLIPFMEDCSLESPENERLIDMWARLIASAGSEFKSEHNLFIRLLRELSTEEAKLLEYIVSKESHPKFKDYYHLEDVPSGWHNSYIYIKLQNIIKELGGLKTSTSFEKIEVLLKERAESPGSIIYFFDIAVGEQGIYPVEEIHTSSRGPIDDDFDHASIAILIGLGLIKDYVSPEFWFGDYVFEVRAYHLTDLGSSFVAACIPKSTYTSS